MITGQLIFREAGKDAGMFGRKKMMVVGIVDVPESFDIEGECQYTVWAIQPRPELQSPLTRPHIELHIETAAGVINLTEEIHGEGLGDTLMMPIWRT
jgi:hypothetical protein